jgi:hypothetical protein
MRKAIRLSVWLGTMTALLAVCLAATAQPAQILGTITYAPVNQAAPVPTLSQAAIVILSLLLAAGGYLVLRKSKARRFLASIAAVGLSLAIGTTGLLLVDDARATNGYPTVSLSSASGSQANVTDMGFNHVKNDSGVPLTITGLNAVDPYMFGPTDPLPPCAVGTVLGVGQECYVNVIYVSG